MTIFKVLIILSFIGAILLVIVVFTGTVPEIQQLTIWNTTTYNSMARDVYWQQKQA